MPKIGTTCTTCKHPELPRIELAIARGIPYRVIADRFDLKTSSVFRHAQNHLSPSVRAAKLAAIAPTDIDLEALQREESEGLLQNLKAMRARLLALLEMAEELRDVRSAASVHQQINKNLELVGKLLGQLGIRDLNITQNLLISEDYLRLRHALVKALAPYPEAALAVSRVLREVEASSVDGGVVAPQVIDHTPKGGGKADAG